MGEAVADEAKLALLDVLLDGVKELLLGDLMVEGKKKKRQRCPKRSEKEIGQEKAAKARDFSPSQCLAKAIFGELPDLIHGVPRACHWSIEESRQPCSGWSAPGWQREECRGRATRGRHPSRCRRGAPECSGQQPCGRCSQTLLRMEKTKTKNRCFSPGDGQFAQFAGRVGKLARRRRSFDQMEGAGHGDPSWPAKQQRWECWGEC